MKKSNFQMDFILSSLPNCKHHPRSTLPIFFSIILDQCDSMLSQVAFHPCLMFLWCSKLWAIFGMVKARKNSTRRSISQNWTVQKVSQNFHILCQKHLVRETVICKEALAFNRMVLSPKWEFEGVMGLQLICNNHSYYFLVSVFLYLKRCNPDCSLVPNPLSYFFELIRHYFAFCFVLFFHCSPFVSTLCVFDMDCIFTSTVGSVLLTFLLGNKPLTPPYRGVLTEPLRWQRVRVCTNTQEQQSSLYTRWSAWIESSISC